MNASLTRHTMVLERTHATGAEEWACPICGRRFVAQWTPTLKRLILNAGDETVTHSGGGLDLTTRVDRSARPAEPTDGGPAEGVELDSLWDDWLQSLDFGEDDPDLGKE